MALDRISTLWMGSPLSVMEKLCIASFVKMGHGVDLYIYGDTHISLPGDVRVFDGNDVIPEEKVFKVRNTYSSFSDWFRWKLIFDKGGWWMDIDSVCLKPLDFPGEYVFVGGYGPPGSDDCICSGMFKAPSHSPIMEWGWNKCQAMEPSKMAWGDPGPPLFTEAVHRFGFAHNIVPTKLFLPIYWSKAPDCFICPQPETVPAEAYSLHLYNSRWEFLNKDKNATYPSTCMYEQLKRRFLGDPNRE